MRLGQEVTRTETGARRAESKIMILLVKSLLRLKMPVPIISNIVNVSRTQIWSIARYPDDKK